MCRSIYLPYFISLLKFLPLVIHLLWFPLSCCALQQSSQNGDSYFTWTLFIPPQLCQIMHVLEWDSKGFFFQHKWNIFSYWRKKDFTLSKGIRTFHGLDSQSKPWSGLALLCFQQKQNKAITEYVTSQQWFLSLGASHVTCHWHDYCKLVLLTLRRVGAFLKSPSCYVRMTTWHI